MSMELSTRLNYPLTLFTLLWLPKVKAFNYVRTAMLKAIIVTNVYICGCIDVELVAEWCLEHSIGAERKLFMKKVL